MIDARETTLTARSGQQQISTGFLLEIGWIQLRGENKRRFPYSDEVELMEIDTLMEIYTQYLDLIQVSPRGLADRIFCGETKWVDRVVATLG